jgi:hypothetical protein
VSTLQGGCRQDWSRAFSKHSSKSKNLLFAGLVSPKEQAKPALFGGENNETPRTGWFCLGFTRLEARLRLVSSPRQTGRKWGVIF